MTPEQIREATAMGVARAFIRAGVQPKEIPLPVELPPLEKPKRYRRRSPAEQVRLWLKNGLDPGWHTSEVCYQSYVKWNSDRPEEPMTKTRFGRIMTQTVPHRKVWCPEKKYPVKHYCLTQEK
jgi:hypothetical protein